MCEIYHVNKHSLIWLDIIGTDYTWAYTLHLFIPVFSYTTHIDLLSIIIYQINEYILAWSPT